VFAFTVYGRRKQVPEHRNECPSFEHKCPVTRGQEYLTPVCRRERGLIVSANALANELVPVFWYLLSAAVDSKSKHLALSTLFALHSRKRFLKYRTLLARIAFISSFFNRYETQYADAEGLSRFFYVTLPVELVVAVTSSVHGSFGDQKTRRQRKDEEFHWSMYLQRYRSKILLQI
jgi:hypothetical protein